MTARNERGFTLIELMVALVVFLFAISAATTTFLPLVNQYKQQSKVSESQIEEVIGIELLRIDVENAGYGLPWTIYDVGGDSNYNNDWGSINYPETDDAQLYNAYDDGPNSSPRGIVLGNDAGVGTVAANNGLGINNSDYLVIKATNVRTDDEMQKWTYIHNEREAGLQNPHEWMKPDGTTSWSERNMDSTTKVIAIKPSYSDDIFNILMTSTGAPPEYYASMSQYPPNTVTTELIPFDPSETLILYAVGTGGATGDPGLRMPFNRAEYYISSSNVPSRCAPNSGVLVKSVISHTNGQRVAGLPLLDCVADLQVVFGLDMDDDGILGTYSDYVTRTDAPSDPEGAAIANVQATMDDAELLRNRLKEVRLYILAHEGQIDPRFDYGQDTVEVGDSALMGPLGHTTFNIANTATQRLRSYRWKVYTMVINPENLKPTD
ncbi:MAG: prepilin-type N-terminal cleavage/methylation domain-containing protein [Nitrospirota bacterium]|nr:MAG: prepilin-type N-terminal cleavage/methylation domain-containing protein [Nitrospirota bacterium]